MRSFFPRNRMETMFLCDHVFCLDCVNEYYRNTIRQIKDFRKLKKITRFDKAVEPTDEIKLNIFSCLESKVSQS